MASAGLTKIWVFHPLTWLHISIAVAPKKPEAVILYGGNKLKYGNVMGNWKGWQFPQSQPWSTLVPVSITTVEWT